MILSMHGFVENGGWVETATVENRMRARQRHGTNMLATLKSVSIVSPVHVVL